MTAKLTVKSRQSEWVEGAEVVVDLSIENTGTEPIELPNPTYASSPQPTYTVVLPDGEEVSYVPDRGRPSPRMELIRIAPGATWRGDISPGRFVPLESVGDYEIRAALDWNSIHASAPGSSFSIVPLNLEGIAASISESTKGNTVRECVFIQRDEESGAVRAMATVLVERDPANAELFTPSIQDRGPLPDGTTDIHGTFANYPIGLEPTRWIITTGTYGIRVGTNRDNSSTLIKANSPVRALLTPLATRGPALHILAVVGESIGAEIALARVDRGKALPESVTLQPAVTLQGPPLAASTALAPEGVATAFVVAVLYRTQSGSRVQLARLRPTGAIHSVQQVVLDRMTPFSGLAVHWSSDDRIRTSFTARLPDDHDELQIVEVDCDQELSTDSLRARRQPVRLGGAPTSARTYYFEPDPGRILRAVFITGDDQAWLVRNSRPPQQVHRPSGPFTLIPGTDFWYLAECVQGKLHIASL